MGNKTNIKDLFPDIWDNLYLYQKVFISLLVKSQNLKEQFVTLIPKQRVCVNCGKKFRDRNYYYKPCRGSSKSITDTARFTRTMCCSNECFTDREVGAFCQDRQVNIQECYDLPF